MKKRITLLWMAALLAVCQTAVADVLTPCWFNKSFTADITATPDNTRFNMSMWGRISFTGLSTNYKSVVVTFNEALTETNAMFADSDVSSGDKPSLSLSFSEDKKTVTLDLTSVTDYSNVNKIQLAFNKDIQIPYLTSAKYVATDDTETNAVYTWDYATWEQKCGFVYKIGSVSGADGIAVYDIDASSYDKVRIDFSTGPNVNMGLEYLYNDGTEDKTVQFYGWGNAVTAGTTTITYDLPADVATIKRIRMWNSEAGNTASFEVSGFYLVNTEYAITIPAPEHGAVTSDVAEAVAGATVTLTVTPDAGYKLNTLVVTDAEDNVLTVTDNQFTMPASNVTVTATFIATSVEDYLVPVDFSSVVLADNSTYDADTWTMTLAGGWWTWAGWKWATPQDWSAYKYITVVSQMPWDEKYTGGTDDGYKARIWGGTEENPYGGEISGFDLYWQVWAPRFATNDMSAYAGKANLNNVRWLVCQAENEKGVDFQISAIYLSNTATELIHTRTNTAKDTWYTLCLPKNAAVCGAEVYDVVGYAETDGVPSALYLQRVMGVLEAGKAYIMKSNSTKDITFYNAGAATAAAATDGALKGTLSDNTSVPAGSYILVGNQWKNVVGNNTVNANRAYLTLTDDLKVNVAPSRAIRMTFDGGETTGIETLQSAEAADAVYSLSGVQVKQPTRGIYVKNGKKYVVK